MMFCAAETLVSSRHRHSALPTTMFSPIKSIINNSNDEDQPSSNVNGQEYDFSSRKEDHMMSNGFHYYDNEVQASADSIPFGNSDTQVDNAADVEMDEDDRRDGFERNKNYKEDEKERDERGMELDTEVVNKACSSIVDRVVKATNRDGEERTGHNPQVAESLHAITEFLETNEVKNVLSDIASKVVTQLHETNSLAPATSPIAFDDSGLGAGLTPVTPTNRDKISLKGEIEFISSAVAGNNGDLFKIYYNDNVEDSELLGHWKGRWGMNDFAFTLPNGVLSDFCYDVKKNIKDFSDDEDEDLENALQEHTTNASVMLEGYFLLKSNDPKHPYLKVEEKELILSFKRSRLDAASVHDNEVAEVIGSGENRYGMFRLFGTYNVRTRQLNCFREYLTSANVKRRPPSKRKSVSLTRKSFTSKKSRGSTSSIEAPNLATGIIDPSNSIRPHFLPPVTPIVAPQPTQASIPEPPALVNATITTPNAGLLPLSNFHQSTLPTVQNQSVAPLQPQVHGQQNMQSYSSGSPFFGLGLDIGSPVLASNGSVASMSSKDASRAGRPRKTPPHLKDSFHLKTLKVSPEEDKPRNAIEWVKQLVEKLRGGDKENWFSQPVDPQRSGALNYYDFIKKPMDLGTVLQKIEHNMYSKCEDVIDDVRLVFSNAKTYNPPMHPVHRMAAAHLKLFERDLKQVERQLESEQKKLFQKTFVPQNQTTVAKKVKPPKQPKQPKKPLTQSLATMVPPASAPNPTVAANKTLLDTLKKQNEEMKKKKDLINKTKKKIESLFPDSSDDNSSDSDGSSSDDDLTQLNKKKKHKHKKKKKHHKDSDTQTQMKMLTETVTMLSQSMLAMQQMQQNALETLQQTGEVMNTVKPKRNYNKKPKPALPPAESKPAFPYAPPANVTSMMPQGLPGQAPPAYIPQQQMPMSMYNTMNPQQPGMPMQGMSMNNGNMSMFPDMKKPKKKRDSKELTYQEKRQLGQDVRLLSDEFLPGLLEIIKKDPGIVVGEDEEVELDIDALSTPILREVQRYVRRALSQGKTPNASEMQFDSD